MWYLKSSFSAWETHPRPQKTVGTCRSLLPAQHTDLPPQEDVPTQRLEEPRVSGPAPQHHFLICSLNFRPLRRLRYLNTWPEVPSEASGRPFKTGACTGRSSASSRRTLQIPLSIARLALFQTSGFSQPPQSRLRDAVPPSVECCSLFLDSPDYWPGSPIRKLRYPAAGGAVRPRRALADLPGAPGRV